MAFNYIDLIILVPFLYGLYKGYTKGLILSLATLIGLILGIYGGVKFSHFTSQFLFEQFELDIPLLSFAATFLLIVIAVYLLGKLLSKFVDAIALGIFNNFAGAIFGSGKVIIVLAVIQLFFSSINSQFHLVEDDLLNSSQLYVFLEATSELIFPYFEQLKSGYESSIDL